MNSKRINRNVWVLNLCLGFIFTNAMGYAAEEERVKGRAVGGIVSPAQFETRLQSSDRQLTSIEGLFTRIEAAKTTVDKDKHADELNNTLAAYAKAMMESFDTAMKQAERANKSRGKEGSVELLKSFEGVAVKHENRLKSLDERAQKIKAPAESGSTSEPADGGKVSRGSPMLEKISDYFISPAQAAIALSVYSTCDQSPQNQTACAQAIQTGTTQTAAAKSTFNTCWNNQERVRPKWWRAVKRTGCVTVLAVKLA